MWVFSRRHKLLRFLKKQEKNEESYKNVNVMITKRPLLVKQKSFSVTYKGFLLVKYSKQQAQVMERINSL